MTVYLLFRSVQWEGSYLVAVFASEASAEAAKRAAEVREAANDPEWEESVSIYVRTAEVLP